MNLIIKKKSIKRLVFITVGVLVLIPVILYMNKPTQSLVMGKAEMYVRNLVPMKEFYVNLVGLEVLKEQPNELELGFRNKEIIKLIQKEGFNSENQNEAGLYHNAILFESRSALAESINRVLNRLPTNYQGSADHLVSEAFYFADPEGNGVELYFDKPRSDWQFDQNGKPVMGGIYIDEQRYIQDNINSDKTPTDINMGHIHLKVGNIQTAKQFYVDILKFDIIRQTTDSLFISRDGYHHHIGMNTWQSLGAGKRRENVYGLYSFELKVNSNYFNEINESLKTNKQDAIETSSNSIEVLDPWGNVVKIRTI